MTEASAGALRKRLDAIRRSLFADNQTLDNWLKQKAELDESIAYIRVEMAALEAEADGIRQDVGAESEQEVAA